MKSKDYDKLYKLICDGEIVPCFVDWVDEETYRDVALVKRIKENNIIIGARGIGYGDVYEFSLHGRTEKEAFIDKCKRLNLEYYT